ncbi:putative late blight resistance protein homolog R1A-3 [Silene latifolia]|uniref:putative late blight resistance protein homolog R1A-3 n=1 Tax=Silene latifolia TaxID=37657 RepID=UPI003D7733F6
MSDEFRAMKQGLGLLLCFHTSMVNWNIEKREEIRPHTHDMSRRMKDYAQRAMCFFKLLPLTNIDGKSGISILAQEIANYVRFWQNIRNSRTLNVTCEDPYRPEYETLVCLTDDLQYVLITLLDDHDLPSQMVSDIRRIAEQMEDILCALSPTWVKIFVESGISFAITREIFFLADEAYNKISDLNTPDNIILDDALTRICHVRYVIWEINMKYTVIPSCIDDFFRCARLILADVVLSSTPATRYVRELNVLHTFIKDTGNMKLQDKYDQIKKIFYKSWMQLWSLCLRKLMSKNEFLTLSLDIFKDILLDLIEYLVQMPNANELLHDLRGTAEADNLFVKLVYSLEKNLVKTLTTEGVGDVVEDVEVEVLEAAQNYILFFREFKNDGRSDLKEGVVGFNASLRHAYDEYTKLSSMELSMSELEFFDMLLHLTEFKENDTCNSDQIGVLHDDLSICFSVLHPYTMRHHTTEEVTQQWTQIMKLGCKVNSMMDTFEKLPTWYNKLRVFYVSEEVKLIKENLSRISSTDISTIKVEGPDIHAKNQMGKGHATEHSKDEVSFEEEDRLREQLTTGSRSLEKISIVGMPGLGKTTLAMRLYKDCAKSFSAHAWCYVGQEFQRKDLLQYIVGQISERSSSEMNAMRVEDLAKLLKQCLLQKKNYLVVLDDVWDVDAWDALRICFPPCHNGSRILITSRYSIVGERVCGDGNVLKLNLLTVDRSWHLLQKKVFGSRSCPNRLCEVGKGIAEKCGGLPLSIVMIAGVLRNKNGTEDGWKEIERSLDDHLLNAGSSTVELSYRHLSVGMKQCFLYCAAFSKGTEIPRSKLIRLWIAERFVKASYEQESLESTAEKYLHDLVDRSLLMVAKRGSNHQIQACRVHDLLVDFCIQKSKAEKFLFKMDRWDDTAGCQQRSRICFPSIDDQLVRFEFHGLTPLKPRSVICSSGRYDPWRSNNFVFRNLKSVSLLDLEKHEMGEFSFASVGELTLLRYLSVRGCMKSIPSSIGCLLNLETLIVRGTRGEVEVPPTIFDLSKLRDLLVDKRARIVVHPSNDNCLSSLQNFSTPVLSGSIADQIILRVSKLRKLRCIILEKTFDLSILDRLCHLDSLRVIYQSLNPFCGKLSFPSNLYKLTLSGFRLPWLDIEKIPALLPRLEILKLLLRAFEGEQWNTTATFKNLKYLRMEGLNIKEWEASDDNFPSLERLVVRRCKSLHKIPEEFGNIGDLMGIEAHWCDVSLGKSVLKIKRKQIDGGNMKFEAIIYPPVLDISDDEELSD